MSFQHNAFQHNAFQVQVPGGGTPQSIGGFASNTAAPQVVDYRQVAGYAVVIAAVFGVAFTPRAQAFVSNASSPQTDPTQIAGQVWASARSLEGSTGANQHYYGSHAAYTAEYAATRLLQKSVPTPPSVNSVPRVILARGQDDPAQIAGQTFKPLAAAQSRTVAIPLIFTPEQSKDLAPSVIWPSAKSLEGSTGANQQYFGSHAIHLAEYGATRYLWRPLVSGKTPQAALTLVVSEQGYVNPPSTVQVAIKTQPVASQAILPLVSIPEQPQPTPPSIVWQSQVSGQKPPVIPLVQGAPELRDLTQQATLARPVPSPQGPTVRPFSAAPLQLDLTLPAVWVAPQENREGPVPPLVQGVPQLVDLTLPAVFSGPLANREGPIPPLVTGSQADPSQLKALVIPPAVTPPITSGQLGTFPVTQSQFEERPTQKVYPSLVSGAKPQQSEYVWAGQQEYRDVGPLVWSPATSLPGNVGSAEIFTGTHAIFYAEYGATRMVQGAAATPPAVQSVPRLISTPPQVEPDRQSQTFEIVLQTQTRVSSSVFSLDPQAPFYAEYAATRLVVPPAITLPGNVGAASTFNGTHGVFYSEYAATRLVVPAAATAPVATQPVPRLVSALQQPDPSVNYSATFALRTFTTPSGQPFRAWVGVGRSSSTANEAGNIG